ncbi:MAG: hypothetical protein JW760_03835 [Spirochaetales bacterium]|nr:hypothetical protein [Spirochaetales bacterium]
MKRSIIILVVLACLLSCVTSLGNWSDPQSVVEVWSRGFREGQIRTVMSAYWSEATAAVIDASGREQNFTGNKEIKVLMKKLLENRAEGDQVYLQVAELKSWSDVATCTLKIQTKSLQAAILLELEKREGRWGIIRQVIK